MWRIKTPRTIWIAASLVVCHFVLDAGVIFYLGPTDYQTGQVLGKLIWIIIVVIALLRVVKYGWSCSLFVIGVFLFQESRELAHKLDELGSAGSLADPWLLFIITNLPLGAAIVLLLPEASRSPFRSSRNPVVSKTKQEPTLIYRSNKEELTERPTPEEVLKQYFSSLTTDKLIDTLTQHVEHKGTVLDILKSRGIFNKELSKLKSQRIAELAEQDVSATRKMGEKIRHEQEIPSTLKEHIALVERDMAQGEWWKAKRHIKSVCREIHDLLDKHELKTDSASNQSRRMLSLFEYLLGIMRINENEATFFCKININFLLRACLLFLACTGVAFVLHFINSWLILLPAVFFVIWEIIDMTSIAFEYEGDSPFNAKRGVLADAALANIKKIETRMG